MDAEDILKQELREHQTTGHSFETELLGDTYGLGATVKAFIEKLQQNRMVDPRWVAIAKTHFQEGLSATRRAIMKDERY